MDSSKDGDICVQVCMHVHVPVSGFPQQWHQSKWHGANVSMADDATPMADCINGTTSLKFVDGYVAIWKWGLADCLG